MGHTGWWAGSCEITPPDRGVQHHPGRAPFGPIGWQRHASWLLVHIKRTRTLTREIQGGWFGAPIGDNGRHLRTWI